MAETKHKPMTQELINEGEGVRFKYTNPDGTEACPSQEYMLKDFPQNARSFFEAIGFRSKIRSFGNIEGPMLDGKATPATPQQMAAAVAKGAAALLAGELRVAREAGEKATSQMVEAAYLYRMKKAKAKGLEFTETLAQVEEAFNALPEEKVEELKGTTLFKLALAEVKEKRAAAKRAQLEKEAMEEAAAQDSEEAQQPA